MAALLLTGGVILVFIIILLLIGIYAKNTNAICTSKKRLDGRTVLVTGGTAGMGLEMARDLAQRGARVIVACPFPDEGVRAVQTITRCSDNQNVVFKLLDLASFASTRNFATDILNTEDRLDILINNAGVGGPLNAVTCDSLNFTMQVNYYGAFLLTILLLPLLKKSGSPEEPSRIVNVSSMLHWFGVANIGKHQGIGNLIWSLIPAYSISKLYVILFSRELTKRLKGFNVVINNSDPGPTGTTIFLTTQRHIGWIISSLFYFLSKTPWQGAQTTLHVALDKEAGKVSGQYFSNCKLSRAISRAYNDKTAMSLWEESVRLVKLSDQELDRCLKDL